MGFVKETSHLGRIAGAAAILNLALNLAFVPVWGMLASAWATAAAYLFLTARYAMVGQRLWRIAYRLRPTLLAAAVTVVWTAAARVLPDVSSVATLAAKLGYVLSYAAALALCGVLGRDDLARMRAILSRDGASATT
jgi:O-antigen/teichoic acid export membrane protein